MGIDIYTHWKNQNETEKQAQFTGFSTTDGATGYLREAYHGSPYITKYLVSEAFQDSQAIAKISAKVLRKRLPIAILMALYRNKKVYENKEDVGVIELTEKDATNKLVAGLADIFTNQVKDVSHEEFSRAVNQDSINYAKLLIESRKLPDYALSFVEFVELCERKEKETGEPCEIQASY